MADDIVNITSISCQKFKCSARGLILPFGKYFHYLIKTIVLIFFFLLIKIGIESCMSIQLRAVLYFIFLLYLFLGIAIIADIFMSSIETITSRRRKIRYPEPGEKDKYITVEVRIWNDTVANLTLMALGSSSPEILLSIIEIVGNRFESGELGPGTSKILITL
jgi:hypothetical protein